MSSSHMGSPISLNRMIETINKMFPDMKLNISRPGGTQLNAIVEIHLERILKVNVRFFLVLGIRIRRIRMFLGLPDPDPLVRGPFFFLINMLSGLK
jgi:hypothetical protein